MKLAVPTILPELKERSHDFYDRLKSNEGIYFGGSIELLCVGPCACTDSGSVFGISGDEASCNGVEIPYTMRSIFCGSCIQHTVLLVEGF